MGDRVLMQCWSSKTDEVGPVLYCHWGGRSALATVDALRAQMAGRGGDLEYASARLVQCAIGESVSGNTGFGIRNFTRKLTAGNSEGDAGCVLIDVDTNFSVQCVGGYLAPPVG